MNLYNALMDVKIVKKGYWKLQSEEYSDLYISKDKIDVKILLDKSNIK